MAVPLYQGSRPSLSDYAPLGLPESDRHPFLPSGQFDHNLQVQMYPAPKVRNLPAKGVSPGTGSGASSPNGAQSASEGREPWYNATIRFSALKGTHRRLFGPKERTKKDDIDRFRLP